MFIRVRDPETGHQFDTPESDPRIGQTLHKVDQRRWPPSRVVRPPKHHLNIPAGGSGKTEPIQDSTAITTPEE